MDLDIETGLRLIIKAKEEERDDRIFQQWTAQLPIMAWTGKIIEFKEYKERVTGSNIDKRPDSVILAEIEEIEKQFEREEEQKNGIRDI